MQSNLSQAMQRVISVNTCACMKSEFNLARRIIASLQNRLDAAEDALEFYSNNPKSHPDGGEFAKKTLKIIQEKKL